MDLTAHQGFFTHFRLRQSLGGAGERGGLVVEDIFGKPYNIRKQSLACLMCLESGMNPYW